MESGNGGSSSKGVFVPVSLISDVFQNDVLAPLKSAYLYEESEHSFRYKSAVLIKNPDLEEKYNAFRAKRRELGYSEEDLKESYGFLLFDDVNKANELGETGVLTGNSSCTTLGDPSNGVYISMYSDCLDINRWYNGKTGYIAIIRLTKGRVKRVSENYTQNFTAPTDSFDCHVSEQLPSVSAKTSSFLAFERSQYYMYELLHDGSNETVQSPSAACPFAIVSFSYMDTKDTPVAQLEKSEEKKMVYFYFPWRGQLQIGTHVCDVELRSTAGALIPAELPPVVKVDHAISMLELRKVLPKAAFETCYSGEVCLEGLYFSLCELISSEVEDTNSLSLLLWEIKDKDVALTTTLNDGGFLILLHSSHFLTYDDTGSSVTEVMQGMFVFPDSRVIHRDTKIELRKPAVSSEILRILPVLSYAESEVEKTSTDPSEELCEVFVQHMQSYAALINPGLASSPSRDLSIFPDQYDVPNAHKHLYSSPEWTNRAWQNFRSYLSKPVSFQLPVSKASEILAAGQEEKIEDLNDNVYFCLSSPEEAPDNHGSVGTEDQMTGQKPSDVEISVDSSSTSTEAQVDQTVPQNVEQDEAEDATKNTQKSDLTPLTILGVKDLVTPSTSEDLPAELIVSITAAKQSVTKGSLSVISSEPVAKHNDFQLSDFSTANLQTAGVNSLIDETVKGKMAFDCPELTNLTKRKCRKLHRGHCKSQKYAPKACIETSSLQTVKIQLEDDNLRSQNEEKAKESSGHSQLSRPSNIDWKKVRRRKHKFSKLSSRNKKVRSVVVLPETEEKKSDSGQSFESTILVCPLRKKMERWDLKPVISECGRILVPHGTVDIADQIKTLRNKLRSTEDASVNADITEKVVQESSIAPVAAVDETEATTSKGGGDYPQNVSPVNPEHNILRQSDDHSGSLTLTPESSEHSSKNDFKDTPTIKTVQEKHADTHSVGKCATKGEFLLNKLKSVLLRGKRKTGIPASEEMTADVAQDTEPYLKKVKVASVSGMLKSNDAITSVQGTNLDVSEVSGMLSLDPLFAYALGLTPKMKPSNIQTSEGQDTQQRKDSLETREQSILEQRSQILQRPLSIFPRRSRIKTLRKHQGISSEYVKKKWWLHFQTPACFASENLKYKEFTRDNSVMRTVEEKSNSACSSTDALNLLADLALSASDDKVPSHPDPTLDRKCHTSLKKGDFSKDVTGAEQESVLHALLRQPAAKRIQPQAESPSPSQLVGRSDLVSLVCEDHAYSLPPSSSLLLGLSGAPFQVSPLSGSTRLLHHHQTMYGDGIRTLHSSVVQEDRNEHNKKTPEYLKKHMACRRKFRNSRTFISKDGSVQVTKQWKENYDFNLDSKFTSDLKNKTIIRALHGPWDFSIQDTSEEVRLIVHMWIGLFYSRSTARFFHVDSNCTYPYSEEIDSLENGMVPDPSQSERKADSFAPFPTGMDPSDTLISNALDLSKKDVSVLDQESVTLDLSLRKSNAEMVASDPEVNKNDTCVPGEQKETCEEVNTLNSSMGLQMAGKFQCYQENVHSTEIISDVNDVRSTYGSERTCTPFQKVASLEPEDVPSFKGDGIFTSVQEEVENVSIQPQNLEDTSGIGHALHDCNNEIDMKDETEKTEASEMGLVQKQERDSSESEPDKEADSDKKAVDVVHTVEHDEIKSKAGENSQFKAKKPGNSIGVVDLGDQQLPMMCNGPDLVKNCITETYHQVALDEQSRQEDNTEDASQDLQLRKLCANGSALTDEHAISEDAPSTSSALSNLSSDDHEDCDTKSFENGKNVDHTTKQELFHHQFHSTQCASVTRCQDEESLAKETDLKSKKNEGLDKIRSQDVIPFIGIDAYEDASPPHCISSECKVEEIQSRNELPFLWEPSSPEIVLPTEVYGSSQMFRKNAELSAGKMSLSPVDVNEINQPDISGRETNDRSPTPTMDEKPYLHIACSGPSSSCAINASETCKNKPMVNINPSPHHSLDPDLEQRILRVLQSTEKFFSKSRHADTFSQNKIADVNHTQDQMSNTRIKCIPTCLAPSHIPADFKCSKTSNTKSMLESASTSQELHTESSGHLIVSPFKGKLEGVLCDWMELKRNDSSVKLQEASQDGPPFRCFTSTECVQSIKQNIDQDGHKATSHTSLSHEPHSNSQRPVMAVKPSKSDEIQADCISEEGEIEHSTMLNVSTVKQIKPPAVTDTTPSSMLLEKNAESLKGYSAGLSDGEQKAIKLYTKSSWSSNEGKSNLPSAKFGLQDSSCQYEGKDILKFNKIKKNSSQKVGQTTKESIQIDQKDCSDALNSAVHYKDDSKRDDSHFFKPQSSLRCTVFNNNQKRSDSFLEQLSQRCIQNDLTKASMEQECLIFSEQMKQLLKRSKKGPIHQLDTHDKLQWSCSSPVIVHFSNLEDQDDSVDHLDTRSLLGQKIMVDMSDRKDLGDTKKKENAMHPQKPSQGTGNPMEHAGVSAVTAECAKQYTAMMNAVCAFKKAPFRHKFFRMDEVYPQTEPSSHFDFCDQMKREMDESFHSKLNTVVKKSCKTKHRFYILVTSDDAFFGETKAQLEADGHTAVQPSEFFLGEGSSSSLLIILKNEDIAENIYKVPHLLELKKSPSVQFAGIDKPDDVVNLTHQELFVEGGFVLFDSAVLESLSLCNMKKLSESLQQLSRMGKWKWILHYRDSRRLKENARFSVEAKEKKHFLNWCQDVGIMEVLPYHKCDLMSRDQPDYLTCLVRLQVQNISARYPVLVTDKTADDTYGTNGIFTMTLNCFLTCSPREIFTV